MIAKQFGPKLYIYEETIKAFIEKALNNPQIYYKLISL